MRRVAAAPRSPGESDQRPDRSASERSVSLAARGDIHSAVIGTQAGLIGEFGGPAIVNVTLSTRLDSAGPLSAGPANPMLLDASPPISVLHSGTLWRRDQ